MTAHEEKLSEIVSRLNSTSEFKCTYFHGRSLMVPNRKEIILIIKNLQSLMFPDYFQLSENRGKSCIEIMESTFIKLKQQLTASYFFCEGEGVVDTETLAYEILSELPDIKEMLIKDIQAIYEGDPAAQSPEEVILSYPGFYAISIYRIANRFYKKKIPYIASNR